MLMCEHVNVHALYLSFGMQLSVKVHMHTCLACQASFAAALPAQQPEQSGDSRPRDPDLVSRKTQTHLRLCLQILKRLCLGTPLLDDPQPNASF